MKPSVPFVRLSFIALLCLGTASAAWGQAVSGSQMSGVVRDASGGVLPGATVTASNSDTGLSRPVYTTHEGAYVLPNLPVGRRSFSGGGRPATPRSRPRAFVSSARNARRSRQQLSR